MKFIVLGTSDFTLNCAKALLEHNSSEICALISMPEKYLPDNSANIKDFANRYNIPYYEFKNINSFKSIAVIKSYNPDYILSSWPKILERSVLDSPRFFTIGTHPTDLPFNRGRHPLHWLIILGIKETKLSFFMMDKGVDTGRILLQLSFNIEPNDTISEVCSKMNTAGYEGTRKLCRCFFNNPLYRRIIQDHRLSNYWRKRTPHDITLDMRMSVSIILRTVRSFALPYPCANLIFEKYVLKISNASIVKEKMSSKQLQRIEPGKILSIKGNKIQVKADDGIVEFECRNSIPSSLVKAKYIHSPSKYILKWPQELSAQLLQ